LEEFHQEGLFLAPSLIKIFYNQQMNISPHLLIDAVILSSALTMSLFSRAKGKAFRNEK